MAEAPTSNGSIIRDTRGSVASVERAGQILRLFLDGKHSLALSEIAAGLELPTSTAHRLLRALCRAGLLEHDTVSRRYELSLFVHQLGKAVNVKEMLVEAAIVPLERLHRMTGEACHISVPELPVIVFVERRDSPSTFQFLTEKGVRAPANCTATGKVFLAYASRVAREQVFATGLVQLTPRSIVDVPKLRAEIDLVRERGYAVCDDETAIGSSSIAVPIRDLYGRVIAGVGLAGRTERMRSMSVDSLRETLMQTSRQVSEAVFGTR